MGAVEEMMCVVCVSVTEGHSGDGCDLGSTLCKYDLRKGYLFVLCWARMRIVRREIISSYLLMCGGRVCMYMAQFVFMSVAVTVCCVSGHC